MIRDEIPGAIVNVTSVSALAAAPSHGPYGAAKSGLAALTRTMAFEWGKYGIRANSVAPGGVLSQRIIDRGGEAIEAALAGNTPDMVWTQPYELGNAITFLLSDLASGISGQNLVVDSALSTKFCGGIQKLEIRKPEQAPSR